MVKEQRAAILVDGGFFKRRYRALYPDGSKHSPEKVAAELQQICRRHLLDRRGRSTGRLYRIYYYDCKPLEKRVHHPLTSRIVHFGKSAQAIFQYAFLAQLRKTRKVALRLGYLKDTKHWELNPRKTKDLVKGKISILDLKPSDIRYQVNQKSVDIKIGIDIATLAYKRLVEKIILISGDGDFVPAAKMARREGIDFVLDPMWNPIDDSLFEHIDGLRSTCPRPLNKQGARDPILVA